MLCQRNLPKDLVNLWERIRNSKKGCIASVQGIYFQDEDLINTPTANTFAQLHAIDAKFNVTDVVKNFLEEAEI